MNTLEKIKHRFKYFRYYYLNFGRIWYKMKIIIKPKPSPIPLEIDKCILIEEITWKEFKFEHIKWIVKRGVNGAYWGAGQDAPDKIKQGHYRQNLIYRMTDDSKTVYIARFDGIFRIKTTTQDTSRFIWKNHHKLKGVIDNMYDMLYQYRHKPIHEIRDIVISTEELKVL